ncbi:MAG: GNAT family N-acetyltransferase, partial [Desulfobacterales bacterium]|nr:GNAT family N-acetyltransferase [Desulfobacterales bacterium]
FPNSIEWQGPRYIGHNWWSKVLSLPFAETCVATRSNKIVGFCTLILDPVRFQIFNKQEALPTSFLLKLLIKKPSIFIKKIEEKLNGILNLIIGDLEVEHFETDASGIAWLEFGSVLPMYRRRGIFKRMITFFENRSKECGMLYIGGHIESHNSISTKFFLNMDYKVTHKATSGIVIKKKL